MTKADNATKELQRHLGRLMRLDGTLLRTAEGPLLLADVEVRDPFVLLAACEARGPRDVVQAPALAALRAGLVLGAEPEPLTTTRVARARRDLRALAALPWLSLVRAAPRHFRGFGAIDERWFAAREARVDVLAGVLHPEAAALAEESVPAELVPVLGLVADLRGAHARDTLLTWLSRSAALGAGRRRDAQARIDGLARRLTEPRTPHREPPAVAAMLDAAAQELGRIARLPGRAAARRLESLLRGVLAWPAAAGHAPMPAGPDAPAAIADSPPEPGLTDILPGPRDSSTQPVSPASLAVSQDSSIPPVASDILLQPVSSARPSRPAARAARSGAAINALVVRLRSCGAALIQALGGARSPTRLAALRRVLGAYALAFPQPPGAPTPPPLAVDELEHAESCLREAVSAGLPAGLPLARALWLLRLPVAARTRPTLARWVADGLPPALVDHLAQLKQLERLVGLDGDAALATAYGQWLALLVPHYQRLGVTLELSPEHFVRLHATHRGGLALLAHCLIVHHVPDERAVDARQARLRATLGLFTARPQRAEALLADLSRAPPGLGARQLPEFAAWLADPALLDRYCHLCALADEPVTLSSQLRRDFDRRDRLRRQHDFLAGLPSPNPSQQARLAACAAELARPDQGDRGWTRRRLAERNEALQARAFALRLDLLLREVLAEAIGVAPPVLTPAWRDALRFYLGGAARNRGLLGEVLRFAAANPGRAIAPTLAKNQAWLARNASRLRADAWLAPRQRALDLDGQRHILVIEDDPLEVLRMGIPFDTCLALDDGFNADSTVLNAVDINKRVLYLRDARGSVVARKLIAISGDFALIGYRLYTARDAAERPGVAAAVLELCRELADESGLPLAAHGAPETIHTGFWYDDGTEPWDNQADHGPAGLAPYFAALGVAPPANLRPWSIHQAHAWQAHAAGDLEAALALLPDLRGLARSALCGLVVARLGARVVASRARREPALAWVHLWQTAQQGPVALLRALTKLPDPSELASEVGDALDHAPPSAELGRAWIAACQHTRRHTTHFDDHGLEHRSFRIGPHLACMPLAEAFASCAALDALWSWIAAESPGCSDCRVWGEQSVFDGLRQSFVREPDPAAVIQALRGRHGPLACAAALEIAARFSLAQRPCPLRPGAGDSWFTRLEQRPAPAPQALRALRELQRSRPDLADSDDLFAALVRQAGPASRHERLPAPKQLRFHLLGEFLLHVEDPIALLAPWLDPGVAPDAWKPDHWELHVHRRGPTPWRRRLARLAAADPDADAPRRWLARLGDVDALTRTGGRAYLAHARDLAWQLERHALQDSPAGEQHGSWDMSSEPSDLAPRGDLRGRDRAGVDPLLLRAALRALLADPGDAHALAVCHAAELEPHAWHDLLARLLPAHGPPAPTLLPLLQELLANNLLRGLPVAHIARLAAVPTLHPALLEFLAVELQGYRVQVHALHSQLERMPSDDPAARDIFLRAWLVRTGEDAASIDTMMGADDEPRTRACLTAWTEDAPPATLLAIARQLDHHHCAVLLQRLLALPAARDQDLRDLQTLAAEWEPHGDDDAVTHAWLHAALAARFPPAPPGPQ